VKLLVIVLISWMLVACGGADEVSTSSTATPTTQANLPQPAAKAATVLGGNDIAVRMYQALYGKAPSNAQLSSYAAQIASSGESAFAASLAAQLASTSDSALAKLVMDNLGVTTTTVTASGEYATLLDALGQMFGYYGTNARGQIILNATKLLVDLTTDPTWGVAAVAYNNQAQANITYSTNSANTVAAVASTAVVKQIAAGWGHAMILKSDGTVWAWGGMNDYGQHGTGTSNRGANPLPVQSLISSVSMISAGYGHSVAVKSDGSIWNWGWNEWSKLGNAAGDTTTPVVLSGLTNPKTVSAGSSHTMILKSDGTVWGVGKSRDGQLCNGEALGTDSPWYNTGHATPVQMVGASGVGYMSNVIAVGTGASNTAVVKSDGTVWMCGWMQNLVPGSGSWNTSIPLQVAGLTGVVDVTVADYRMYALKNDGTVWSWGLIVSDMVPYNGSTSTATPVQVTGLSNVVAISSHTSHALALKRDGTVWSWGQNEWGWGQDEWGKLGNNLKGDSATPVQVVGPNGIGYLTGITAIDTGSNSSLALRNDGTVWAWGENSYGYLGNGGTTRSAVPTQVTGLTASTLLAPSNLTASAISAAVALTWTEVTGAKSYNIYRSSLRADSGTLLGNTVSINYSDASALSGTTYYYHVTAVAGALESIPSSKVAAVATTTTQLAPPTNVSVSNSGTQTVGSQTFSSSTKLSVSWTAPGYSVDHYEISAVEAIQNTTVTATAATSSTSATLTGLKSATPYSVSIKACASSDCNSAASTTAISATTSNEVWQVRSKGAQGSGNTWNTAQNIISDSNTKAWALAYGSGAGAGLDGTVRLFYDPNFDDPAQKGVKIGYTTSAATIDPISVSSFTPATGYGLRFVRDTNNYTIDTSVPVPLSAAMGGKIRLFMEFSYTAPGNNVGIYYIDSQDGYTGLDYNKGSATVCSTDAEFAVGGDCAPTLAVGGSSQGFTGIGVPRQFKIGYPTLTDWRWNGDPGTFIVFSMFSASGACSSAINGVGYAQWDGSQWVVSHTDGCPKYWEHMQAPVPLHLGGVKYKMYYGHSDVSDTTCHGPGTKKILYADGTVSGNSTSVEYEDWEAKTNQRDITFLWPDGSELDSCSEKMFDDFTVYMPTFSTDFQVMYMVNERSWIAMAVLLNP
jgi:alpha-tubulin suppressor-like RCC1 family protein